MKTYDDITREQLASVYLNWRNNYVTVERFASDCGLYPDECELLIELARKCYEKQHPEA